MSKTTKKLGKPLYILRTVITPLPPDVLFNVTLNSRFQRYRELGLFDKISDAVATKYRDTD